jgi:hypothetical protein
MKKIHNIIILIIVSSFILFYNNNLNKIILEKQSYEYYNLIIAINSNDLISIKKIAKHIILLDNKTSYYYFSCIVLSDIYYMENKINKSIYYLIKTKKFLGSIFDDIYYKKYDKINKLTNSIKINKL